MILRTLVALMPLNQLFKEFEKCLHFILETRLDDGLIIVFHLQALHLTILHIFFPFERLLEALHVFDHPGVLLGRHHKLLILVFDVLESLLGYY